MLRLTLLFSMVPMDTLVLAMLDTEDLDTLLMLDILIPDMDTLLTPHTPMDTIFARGLLMLSPRLKLILLSSMVPMDTLVLAMLDIWSSRIQCLCWIPIPWRICWIWIWW